MTPAELIAKWKARREQVDSEIAVARKWPENQECVIEAELLSRLSLAYKEFTTDLESLTPQWKDAPDAPGFWWWWKPGFIRPELVEARDICGSICLYSAERVIPWGGHSIENTKEHLGGRWLQVVRPEPPKG